MKKCNSVIFLIIFTWAVLSATGQELPVLILNQSIEQTGKGGEAQFFKVTLSANQTARVEIIQKGIDVSLAAYKPTGEKYIETESPSGLLGEDLILVVAGAAGEYKIEVSPADPKAVAGKYLIKLAEIRATVPEDFLINETAHKITVLANETQVLRTTGTREGKRQAIENFTQIIELSKVKKDKIWETVAVISIGLVYEQLGEFQKSLDFYVRGLDVSRTAANKQYEGSSLNNLGNAYNTLGDYEKAIFYLNQALVLQRETGNKRGEAIILNNLGTANLSRQNYPQAQEFYEKSLVLRREIKDQRGEGNTLNNLGQTLAQSGKLLEGIALLQQALTLRRTLADKQGEAASLRNLGRTFWLSGEPNKAFEYFTNANLLAKQLGDRRIEADSLYWLALAEQTTGNLPKAIENIENGLNLIEQIRGEIINPELRTSYFSTVQQFYELYTDLLVARFEKTKNEADLALALQTSEKARTRSLVELLQEAKINFKQGVTGKFLEQAGDLQDALNAKYRQRTTLLSGKNTPPQIIQLNNEINGLTVELESLQTKIRRENPRFAELTRSANFTVKEMQNILNDETVLLEYKLGEKRSFLWFLTKNSLEVHELPKRREIEKQARNYYEKLINRAPTSQAEAAKLSVELSRTLLAPIAQKLNRQRLLIVADGVLEFIPFASLQVQSPKTDAPTHRRADAPSENPKIKVQSSKFKVQSPTFLIENHEIVNLPSASVLSALRKETTQTLPTQTLAIFADPVFEENDVRVSARNVPLNTTSAKTRGDEIESLKFSRLPFSRREANAILAIAPKEKVFSALDFAANRENLGKINLTDFRIIHFATHGLLDSQNPAFSGVVLSLVNEKGEVKDGFLRLNEIYNLNLNADLVVLSACRTALGKEVRGEGLIGLTRGFFYAGSSRVMASLWSVDDAATAELMSRFYKKLLQEKMSPAASLRAAKLEMLAQKRFQNPYFWASFTLQGDWR